jgi:hypothetical protein
MKLFIYTFIVIISVGLVAIGLETYDLLSFDTASAIWIGCIIALHLLVVGFAAYHIIREYTNPIERGEEE